MQEEKPKKKISIVEMVYWIFLVIITPIVFTEMNKMGGINESVMALTFVASVVQLIYIFKKKPTGLIKMVSWIFLLFFMVVFTSLFSASGAQMERESYLMEHRGV